MLYHHSNCSNGEKWYFNYLFIHFVHLSNFIYLFTQASKFGAKRKKHHSRGKTEKGLVRPGFRCFFLQQWLIPILKFDNIFKCAQTQNVRNLLTVKNKRRKKDRKSLFLFLSVSFCLCLSLSVSVCLCLSLSVSVCLCLSLSVLIWNCLSVYLSVCLHFHIL